MIQQRRTLASGGTYPTISIVTPCLNDARFIDDAIRSVLDQGYPNVEHIIIDGGSTDETLTILKRYPHLKWISEPDQGLTDALNKGLRRATGEIIGWLNSDDYYLPGAFTSVAAAFDRNDTMDIVYGDFEFVDLGKRPLGRLRNSRFDPMILMFYRNYIPSNAAFWRRRIIDDGHFLDTSFKVVMDWDWWLQLTTLGYQFLFIPENLAAFRIREDNIGNRLAHLFPAEHQKIREKFENHFLKRPIGKAERTLLFYLFRGKRALHKLRRGIG